MHLLLRMLHFFEQIRIKNRRRNLVIPRSPLPQINRPAAIRTKRHIRIIQRNSLLTNRTLQNFGSHKSLLVMGEELRECALNKSIHIDSVLECVKFCAASQLDRELKVDIGRQG